MNKKDQAPRPVKDSITIGEILDFEAFTTITWHDNDPVELKIEFILENIQDVQLVGSLFDQGQWVGIRSEVLTGLEMGNCMVLIKSIRVLDSTLCWICDIRKS